jgi:hypothetical protein
MAETKKEVVDTTTKKEQPKVDNEVGKLKVKKKPKMKKFSNKQDEITKLDMSKTSTEKEEVTKVDLTEPQETKKDTEVKQETTDVVNDEQTSTVEEVVEETPQKEVVVQDEATSVIEEVTEEEQKEIEQVKEEVVKAVEEAEATGAELPENIQKLMDFMEDTGGDLEDYVKLNKDISKLNDNDVLYEYYKQTKSHLTNDEINFLMEDQFSYDEEVDDERDIKRKKLALKEQVASARAHLDGQKSKYYEEIKAGSKLTSDQQKAIDFFNRYNKESEATNKTVKRNTDIFKQRTNEFFGDKFKGFEYNVGDKKYRFNVNNKNEIKEAQSDLNNFTSKFVDENSALKDAKGYHKSLFTAMNSDAVAKHFYEQGRADALKESVAKSKNVNMDPRQSHKEVNVGGVKYRVLGDDSSDFKFKIKNKR